MEDILNLEQSLDQDTRLLRDNLRRFVDQEIIPLMPQAFEKGELPAQLIPKMADLGLFGMTLPENYGGSNASYLSYGLACQELERGDSGLRSFTSVQSSLCMFPIFKYGSLEQKQRFLPKMAKGEIIGCFGLTEPNSGSNPAGLQTTAIPNQNGWLLNGSKLWITNADIADVAIVWAQTPEGIRGFLVERTREGFSSHSIKEKLSLRVGNTGGLTFINCQIPESHLLPGTEVGLRAALSCLTEARYGIAWGAIGAAIACFDQTLDYTLQRKQFEKPIAGFQLVQKDLVDMFTEITKAQAINFQIGQLADQQKLTPELISLAKMNAAHTGLQVARKCRNLLGANGIILEYHVIRHMLNLESVFTYEGTDNIHHLILGKYLTGLNALT